MATKSKATSAKKKVVKKKVVKKKVVKKKAAMRAEINGDFGIQRDVLVIGVGTIGEPLTRLLLEHREDLDIGDVYFAKFNPTDLGTVKLLQQAGGKFVIWKETEAHFEHVFRYHGLSIDGTIEDTF